MDVEWMKKITETHAGRWEEGKVSAGEGKTNGAVRHLSIEDCVCHSADRTERMKQEMSSWLRQWNDATELDFLSFLSIPRGNTSSLLSLFSGGA